MPKLSLEKTTMSGTEKLTIKTLTEKSYRLRLLTSCYRGEEHSFIIGGKEESVRCTMNSERKGCPLCNYHGSHGFYLVGAIDRTDNEYGIFKINRSLFSSISSYVNNKNWGDPKEYDFAIENLEYESFQEGVYRVAALAKNPLTEREKNIPVDKNMLDNNTLPFPSHCVKSFIRNNRERLGYPYYDVHYMLKY